MEKVIKSVNSLKFIYGEIAAVEEKIYKDGPASPKDRQNYCNTISDIMVSNNMKNHSDFNALLAISLEILLQACSDENADVRLNAEECLNRLIKGLHEQYINKILVELFKEVKKNGHPRTLKAALTRFSELTFNIRPSKCRPYILNILPCLVFVSQREEEIIQEALAPSLSKIFSYLGSFANEGEIQGVIASFLKNLSHPSVTIRRTAALCLQSIVVSSRKLLSTLNAVIETVLDILTQRKDNRSTILGCFQSLRLLSSLYNKSSESLNNEATNTIFLKIFVSILQYICHDDHTVITSVLELLEQLLKTFPAKFKELLTTNMVADFLSKSNINDNIPTRQEMAELPQEAEKNDLKLLTLRSVCSPLTDLSDIDTLPVTKLARLLTQRYLLSSETRQLLTDSQVRVSTKTLSLNCLTYLITMEPLIYLLPLHPRQTSELAISDLTLCLKHSDPKLRGAGLNFLANSLRALLIVCKSDVEHWYNEIKSKFATNTLNDCPNVDKIVFHLKESFSDEVSTCLRHSCTAVSTCLNILLRSVYFHHGLTLLLAALSLNKNSYWLLKVDLLELVATLNFRQIAFIESRLNHNRSYSFVSYQKRTLSLIYDCLAAEDGRVRKAAADALVVLVETLSPNQSVECDYLILEVQAVCRHQMSKELLGDNDDVKNAKEHNDLAADKSLLKTYRGFQSGLPGNQVADNLSLVIADLSKLLSQSSSRHLVQGCLLTLKELSFKYSPGCYYSSWGFDLEHLMPRSRTSSASPLLSTNSDQGKIKPHQPIQQLGPLPLVMGFLKSSWLPLDIKAHCDALLLAGNLIAGATAYGFQFSKQAFSKRSSFQSEAPSSRHSSFGHSGYSDNGDGSIGKYAQKLFTHTVRIMSVSHHIIADIPPGYTNKSVLPNIGANSSLPSPIKKKDRKDTIDVPKTSPTPTRKLLSSSSKSNQSKEDVDKDKSKKLLGSFHHNRIFMKFYELLLGAYKNYKTNLEFSNADRFCLAVSTAVDVCCQLFEISKFSDVVSYTEEILSYLKTIFPIHPNLTVQCVQQLLKSLFDTNFISQCETSEISQASLSSSSKSPSREPRIGRRFKSTISHQLFHLPSSNLTMSLANSSFHHSLFGEPVKEGDGWFGSIRKKVEEKLNISKHFKGSGKISIQHYIRLFEPLVIKSLKQYTISSSVQFQKHVLNMLAQLVQLRVNYNMLDSDQIFINYVIKQFESIEVGLIKESRTIIPHIFFFLVLLTYEMHHSKSVIGMPKVIQLCDGLMASGREVTSHVVPALEPIVHDLFYVRASVQTQEITAQRDYVIFMLLKLLHVPQVFDMTTIVLRYNRRSNTEKWKIASQQVVSVLLPLLKDAQMIISCHDDVNNLQSLFESLAPSSLKPVDNVLGIMISFQLETTVESSCVSLGKLLVLFRFLSCNVSEADLVTSLERINVVNRLQQMDLYERATTPDGIASNNSLVAFARYLHHFISQVSKVVAISIHNPTPTACPNDCILLVKELVEFLLLLTSVHRSGSYKKLIAAFCDISPLLLTSDRLTNILCIGEVYPVVSLMWIQYLSQLGHMDLSTWSVLTGSGTSEKPTFYTRIINAGSIILLCDYASQNFNQRDLTSWLIKHHTVDIVALSGEAPVEDFLSFLQNSSARNEFLSNVFSFCEGSDGVKASFMHKIIRCVETLSESPMTLTLLISKRFLFSPVIAISRSCDRLACGIAELLLAREADDVVNLITADEIDKLMKRLPSNDSRRFSRLQTLLGRLKCHLTGDPPSSSHSIALDVNIESILESPNKKWLKTILLSACRDHVWSPECAKVLASFEYDDIKEIMSDSSFCCVKLDLCLAYGISESLAPRPFAPSYLDDSLSSIMKASRNELLTRVDAIAALAPAVVQTVQKEGEELSVLRDVCNDVTFCDHVINLCSCLARYFHSNVQLPVSYKAPTSIYPKCIQIAQLGLQILNWRLSHGSVPALGVSISCFELLQQLLKIDDVYKQFFANDNQSAVIAVIDAAYSLVTAYVGPLPLSPPYFPNSFVIDKSNRVTSCFIKTSQLFEYVCRANRALYLSLPYRLVKPLHNVVLHVCRSSHLNSYIRIPHLLWKYGWDPPIKDNQYNDIPADYLQEKDVLSEYICIVNHIGWISRTQFEETWASLLGVLVSQPMANTSAEKQANEDTVAVSCLAVRGLTSLVINSALQPHGGAPVTSRYVAQHRHPAVKVTNMNFGKKLLKIREVLREELRASLMTMHHCEPHYRYQRKLPGEGGISEELSCNTERVIMTSMRYGLGQVSAHSFFELHGISPIDEDQLSHDEFHDSSADNESEKSDVFDADSGGRAQLVATTLLTSREKSRDGVDVYSCVQFLLDLYSSWFRTADSTGSAVALSFARPLLCECVRSLLLISDLFTRRHQFEWLMQTLSSFYGSQTSDDDVMLQYVVTSLCKAAAVLGMGPHLCEVILPLLETALSSSLLSCRTAALYGALYCLECYPNENMKAIINFLFDFLPKELVAVSGSPSLHNEDFILALVSASFLTIERCQDTVTPDFVSIILQCSSLILSANDTPSRVYHAVTRGLERLVLIFAFSAAESEVVLKVAVEQLSLNTSLPRSTAACALMVTCMYCGRMRSINYDSTEDELSDGGIDHNDAIESRLVAMERVSVMFERIRKGRMLDARILIRILPHILNDFFPPATILNKVIAEFASNLQPFPDLVALVLHQVFQTLHGTDQSSLVNEWVILSLSNVVQRTPLSTAVWCLSCLFVSASTNYWINSLLPVLVGRMKQPNPDRDWPLFCKAAIDFYTFQLSEELDRRSFQSAFIALSKEEPYRILLQCISRIDENSSRTL